MNIDQELPPKMGVIGAGFAGTGLVAALHRLSTKVVTLILFDKTGCFGAGDAYKTPFPFHLLNVRARDMSAFENDALHFVHWLSESPVARPHLDETLPLAEQFVPRFLYSHYLNDVLKAIERDTAKKITLQFETAEVVDIVEKPDQALLILDDKREVKVDKVILALGNSPPMPLPFPVSSDVNCIANPWDYTAPRHIPPEDPVLIAGTGLSMIDTVLTLFSQQHRGKIYAVSRRGLIPLPHADVKVPYMLMQSSLPAGLRTLTRYLRVNSKLYMEEGGDWRSLVNELRTHVPALWQGMSVADKNRFMRHIMPYWNVHRHRVHNKLANIVTELSVKGQLKIVSGRISAVKNGKAVIQLRRGQGTLQAPVKWIINCLGPASTISPLSSSLVNSLLRRRIAFADALNLGLMVSPSGALKEESGKSSSVFYALGSLRKGTCWETTAVPEIRKQCLDLAKHLFAE